MIGLTTVNIVFGLVNSALSFSNGNTAAGIGWLSSCLGWLVAFLYEAKS